MGPGPLVESVERENGVEGSGCLQVDAVKAWENIARNLKQQKL